MHTTTCLDGTNIARQQITRIEVSEAAMWTRIASCMPALDTLKIKLKIHEYYDYIVPPFHHAQGSDYPGTFSRSTS